MNVTLRKWEIYMILIMAIVLHLERHVQCHYVEPGTQLAPGIGNNSHGNLKRVTKRENKVLNRKKRYLTFPAGASFIMTISLIKSLMIKAPTGLRLAAECDVPFSLPSDSRWIRRKGTRRRQRREILDQLSMAFEGLGFNGTACIKRAVCDAQLYVPLKGTSLVKDLLMVVFKFDEAEEYFRHCEAETYSYCELPLLNYIEGLMRTGV